MNLESGEPLLGGPRAASNSAFATSTGAGGGPAMEGSDVHDPTNPTEQPKDYHCRGQRGKLLPLYAEPSFAAERVGSLFPGDAVVAHSVQPASDGMGPPRSDFWLKVRVAPHSI